MNANRKAKGKLTSNPDGNEIRKVQSVLGSESNPSPINSSFTSIESALNISDQPQQEPHQEEGEKKEQESQEDNNPQSPFNEGNPIHVKGNDDAAKKYRYWQSSIQSTFAQIQGERIDVIARLARNEKHIIYVFKQDRTPPKLGEKPNKKETLTAIEVYYNEIEQWRHVEWEKIRSEIQHLQRVKQDMTNTIDENGVTIPAKLKENNFALTQLKDEDFANIDNILFEKQSGLFKDIALWMYGIDAELYKNVENTSFTTAIEAGQYREQFGIVEQSKNSVYS